MSETGNTSHRRVPAVTRAVAILRWLGKSSEPVGVNQLARELGLVPSTCLHILRVLIDEGLVAFDSHSKRYSIDVGILPIARGAIQRNNFASLIEPRLTELSHDVGGTIVATQLADADHMVVVALSRARQPFRLQVDLGSRFPALISATGRCHAAYNLGDVSQADLKSRFSSLKWDHPPDYRAWRKEIQKIRVDEFAIDSGDYISGVTIIAVPFFNRRGFMTHSIVAIDITERAEATGFVTIVGKMQTIRDELTDVLIEGVS